MNDTYADVRSILGAQNDISNAKVQTIIALYDGGNLRSTHGEPDDQPLSRYEALRYWIDWLGLREPELWLKYYGIFPDESTT
jgi:hypothetical protein